MLHKTLVAVLASAVVAAAFSVLPADAAKKEEPRYRSDTPPSLDGRTTGWPRTCGHDFSCTARLAPGWSLLPLTVNCARRSTRSSD
jgi:hypothetical protein